MKGTHLDGRQKPDLIDEDFVATTLNCMNGIMKLYDKCAYQQGRRELIHAFGCLNTIISNHINTVRNKEKINGTIYTKKEIIAAMDDLMGKCNNYGNITMLFQSKMLIKCLDDPSVPRTK